MELGRWACVVRVTKGKILSGFICREGTTGVSNSERTVAGRSGEEHGGAWRSGEELGGAGMGSWESMGPQSPFRLIQC